MQKPTPPSTIPAIAPIEARTVIEELSPIIEPLEPPRHTMSSSSATPLCDSCAKCWVMKQEGGVRNKRADGSAFTKTERFCQLDGGLHLFSLAERLVLECNRFVPTTPKTTLD